MATMESGNTMKSDFDDMRVEAAAKIAQEKAEAANNEAANNGTAGVDVEDQAEQVNENEGMGNRLESKSTDLEQRLIESTNATDELARIYDSPEIGSVAPGARDSKSKKEEKEDEDGKVATGKKRGPYKKPAPKLEEVLSALRLEEDVKRSITVHASLEYASMVEAIKMRHQTSYDMEDRLVQSINMQTEVEGALESLEALVGVDHDLYDFGQDLLKRLVGETRFLERLRLEALSVFQ